MPGVLRVGYGREVELTYLRRGKAGSDRAISRAAEQNADSVVAGLQADHGHEQQRVGIEGVFAVAFARQDAGAVFKYASHLKLKALLGGVQGGPDIYLRASPRGRAELPVPEPVSKLAVNITYRHDIEPRRELRTLLRALARIRYAPETAVVVRRGVALTQELRPKIIVARRHEVILEALLRDARSHDGTVGIVLVRVFRIFNLIASGVDLDARPARGGENLQLCRAIRGVLRSHAKAVRSEGNAGERIFKRYVLRGRNPVLAAVLREPDQRGIIRINVARGPGEDKPAVFGGGKADEAVKIGIARLPFKRVYAHTVRPAPAAVAADQEFGVEPI